MVFVGEEFGKGFTGDFCREVAIKMSFEMTEVERLDCGCFQGDMVEVHAWWWFSPCRLFIGLLRGSTACQLAVHTVFQKKHNAEAIVFNDLAFVVTLCHFHYIPLVMSISLGTNIRKTIRHHRGCWLSVSHTHFALAMGWICLPKCICWSFQPQGDGIRRWNPLGGD